METYRTKIGAGGRIVIPAQIRSDLDVKPGDELILALKDGELRIFSLRQAVKRSQRLVRRYVPEGRSLAEELIQDRRVDGARE
jgi:AbrB family looped-hinge helix DNA binding protein